MKSDRMVSSTFKVKSSKLRGQSLIEVIIGVGVAVMLAISLITTSLITQRTARSARNNTQATKLGQEYIEQVRVFRDRKGFSSLPGADSACLIIVKPGNDPDGWSLSPCSLVTPPEKQGERSNLNGVIFYRTIQVDVDESASPPVKATFTSEVKWDETSGGEKVVNSQTILTKWEGLP